MREAGVAEDGRTPAKGWQVKQESSCRRHCSASCVAEVIHDSYPSSPCLAAWFPSNHAASSAHACSRTAASVSVPSIPYPFFRTSKSLISLYISVSSSADGGACRSSLPSSVHLPFLPTPTSVLCNSGSEQTLGLSCLPFFLSAFPSQLHDFLT